MRLQSLSCRYHAGTDSLGLGFLDLGRRIGSRGGKAGGRESRSGVWPGACGSRAGTAGCPVWGTFQRGQGKRLHLEGREGQAVHVPSPPSLATVITSASVTSASLARSHSRLLGLHLCNAPVQEMWRALLPAGAGQRPPQSAAVAVAVTAATVGSGPGAGRPLQQGAWAGPG